MSVSEPIPSTTASRAVAFDPEALYVAIDRERRRRRIRGNREVLRQAGINSPSTINRLGRGESLNADTLIALMHWLGETDLKPYIRASEVSA